MLREISQTQKDRYQMFLSFVSPRLYAHKKHIYMQGFCRWENERRKEASGRENGECVRVDIIKVLGMFGKDCVYETHHHVQ